jgi:hypothetical protein
MDDEQKEILKHNFEVQDKVIKHQIEVEDNTWQSCCLTLDKNFVQFFTQMSILLIVIIFCIIQLTKKADCESQRGYLGLLTFLIGILCPQPKIK